MFTLSRDSLRIASDTPQYKLGIEKVFIRSEWNTSMEKIRSEENAVNPRNQKQQPTMSRLLKFALVALSSLSGVEAADKCDLECNGRGTCNFGSKNHGTVHGHDAIDILPWAQQNSINGMYCKCDPGYTGVTCEIEHEICSDDNQNMCFNGGTCIRLYQVDGGVWENRCDCTTAIKEKDGKLTRYAGQFCQHEETAACNHELFCTNGGACQEDGLCKCHNDFHGPHCEYKKDNEGHIPCELGCQNGGQCAFGMKSYNELQSLSKDPVMTFLEEWREVGFMHCVCPEGYTGVLCDIKYELCKTRLCYFGSTCIDGGHCDCTSAYTNDTSYAGFQCEYPSTMRCPTANGQHPGDAFCTNGGICHNKGSERGCYCPKGFSGPRCEQKGDVPKTCDLECKNGGKCHHGVKYHKFGKIMSLNKKLSKLTKDGMYCACPTEGGFTGVQCEIPVESCYVEGQKEDHICLHGAKCSKDGKDDQGKPKFTCDCSTTTTTDDDGNKLPFAGKFCEYETTEICLKEGDPEYGMTEHFCTNDGKCKDVVESSGERHKGCDCPDGFTGDHCETVQQSLETTDPKSETPDRSSFEETHDATILFIIVIVATVLTLLGLLVTKQLAKGSNEKEVENPEQFDETPPKNEEETLFEKNGKGQVYGVSFFSSWIPYNAAEEAGEMEEIEIL